ncbi:MAG: transposase family protein [Nitrosopumilus sp.]|nr:transposase family protein [Nitrosopumilus sp.]
MNMDNFLTAASSEFMWTSLVLALPPSQGMTYLFTIIDRYTRWPEAIPMADATAASCTCALISHHIAQFGVPADITSDRGPRSSPRTCGLPCGHVLLGAQLHRTTAYHPQANGVVERLHRQLKAALKARLVGPAWMDELPLVLLGLRSAPKEHLGCAPSELVYGTTIRLPGEFFETSTADREQATSELLTQLRTTMATLRPKQTSHHRQQSSHVPVELQDCRFVFVRHDAHRTPLQCTYDGPFRVLERATKYFTLDLNGKRDTVSVDRLKPAFLDADWGLCEEPVTPPPTCTQPALRLPPSTAAKKTSVSPAPPPSTSAKEARILRSLVNPPLRIVKRSRRGW